MSAAESPVTLIARVNGNKEVSTLRIEPTDGSFFLLQYDASGTCVADTWHATVSEAQRQAAFAFAVGPEDWSAEPTDSATEKP